MTNQANYRRMGNILTIVGISLTILGIGLFACGMVANLFESREYTRVVGLLSDSISSDPDKYSNSISIDGYEYIGIIEIPSINLILPVLASCDGANLDKGICLYRENGNYVIGGHNRISQFRPLYEMKTNEVLFFYDIHSNKKEYTLVKTEILLPSEIDNIISNKYGVTLFTCYWNNHKRYVLRFV